MSDDVFISLLVLYAFVCVICFNAIKRLLQEGLNHNDSSTHQEFEKYVPCETNLLKVLVFVYVCNIRRRQSQIHYYFLVKRITAMVKMTPAVAIIK